MIPLLSVILSSAAEATEDAISRAEIKPTDNVLIVGAGPIGLFALLAAKQFAGRVAVADILQNRLDLAAAYGADGIVNTKEEDIAAFTDRFTDGNGFDVCIEACGQPETFLMCIDQAAFAANIILIGNGKRETSFVHSVILKKELNIFGSRNALKQDFIANIETIAAGKIDVNKMVSGIYPMDRAIEAFDALANNKGDLAKLLIRIGD